MTYIKPKFHHPELPTNRLGYTKKEYEGVISTLCAGCGHDSISAAIVQSCFEMNIEPHKVAKMSGIGCSSKTPAYFLSNSHGFNSVHGRMPSVATGANLANCDLLYLGVSGDGDSASIGMGQLVHAIRRNLNITYIVMNNGCYGLTKGQYSPASPEGKITKSSPMGSIDHPFNPAALALGADATFFARSMDRDPIHLREILKRSNAHKGSSVVEIYQNCNVFNDGAFEIFTEKGSKPTETLFLEQGKPLVFGAAADKGIKLDGFKPVVVNLNEGHSADDLWVHDEQDIYKAQILTRIFDDPKIEGHLPRPFGVFYQTNRDCYEDVMAAQIEEAKSRKPADLDKLLRGSEVWTIN